MERDVHQAALARGLDVGDSEHRLRTHLSALEYPYAASPLGEKHVAIRQPRESPRHLEATRNRLNAVLDRVLSRRVAAVLSPCAPLLAASNTRECRKGQQS